MSFFDDHLKQLRILAWIEGFSYLVLLFIAMPLKYLADAPAMVRTTGMLHGVLFVLFVLRAVQTKVELGWPRALLGRVIGTAFIPFGMIIFDRLLRESRESNPVAARD